MFYAIHSTGLRLSAPRRPFSYDYGCHNRALTMRSIILNIRHGLRIPLLLRQTSSKHVVASLQKIFRNFLDRVLSEVALLSCAVSYGKGATMWTACTPSTS